MNDYKKATLKLSAVFYEHTYCYQCPLMGRRCKGSIQVSRSVCIKLFEDWALSNESDDYYLRSDDD